MQRFLIAILLAAALLVPLSAFAANFAQTTPSPITGITNLATTISASGDNVVVTGVASQTIRVYRMDLYCNAGPITILIKSGTTTTPPTLWPAHTFSGSSPGGVILDESASRNPWFTTRNTATATDNSLVINLSAAQTCAVTIAYTQS